MNEKIATALAVSVVVLSLGVARMVSTMRNKPVQASGPTTTTAPTEDGRRTAEASIARLEKALSAGKVSGINAAKRQWHITKSTSLPETSISSSRRHSRRLKSSASRIESFSSPINPFIF